MNVGEGSWNSDSSQKSLGSKVDVKPRAVPVSLTCTFNECLLSMYYVPGSAISTVRGHG